LDGYVTDRNAEKRLLRQVATYLVFGLFVAGAGWAITSRGSEIIDALQRLRWWSVAGSLVFGLLAVLAMFGSWYAAIRDGGVGVGVRDGLRIYGVGQVGKYLPGSVWPVLTQAQLARRRGASPLRMASGALLALAISVCVGLVLGCVLLPFSGPQASDRLWWAPIVAAPMVVLLLPPVLNRLVELAARVLRRGEIDAGFSLSGVARSAGWSAVGNLFFGLHILCLVHPLGAHGLRGYVLSVCAYALASSMGVIVVFAPAGAGFREGVLVAVLAPLLTVDAALVIALVSRVVLIIVDVGLALSQLRGLRRLDVVREAAP
jgi:glycosyltransferase 2 family protein